MSYSNSDSVYTDDIHKIYSFFMLVLIKKGKNMVDLASKAFRVIFQYNMLRATFFKFQRFTTEAFWQH